MEENTELEEGEACYYYKDDDDDDNDNNNIDPDIALSYIDEKIQHVLGHFQKDFEGGVSAENLGAKFGGYGSFLPTYERSPSIWSRPKTPLRNSNAPKSPNNLPMEGASQNFKAPSNAAPSLRLGTASCSVHPLHNSRVPSADVSIRQDPCLPTTQVAEKSSLKDENSNRSGNLTDQRTLKVRIKVGTDNTTRNNAAIYSGLGLDDSPSSSLGNSLEESGGMSPVSQETTDESFTSIIQVMTSFPIPGSVLISPLHDSLLNLMRKEKLCRDSKPMPSINGRQEHSDMLLDELASMLGNGKVLKEKKPKLAVKSERWVELKHGNGTVSENGMSFRMKKIPKHETTEGKEFLSSDLKRTPVSNSVCEVGDYLKVPGGASEVSKEDNKDGVKGRLFSSELVKEESMESISGQDYGKNEKRNSRSSLVENVWENRVVNSPKDVLVDRKDDGKCKGDKTSAPLKGYSDLSKCKEDLDPQKEKVSQTATFHEEDETNVPFKKEKVSFEGKNMSKGMQSNGKPGALSTKESLRFSVSAVPKDKKSSSYGVTTGKSKIQKVKLQKDNKGRDKHRDSSWVSNLEQTDNRMDPVGRPSGDRQKDANLGVVETQRNAFLDKPKGRLSGKKVDDQLISGTSVKDASVVCPPITENGFTSEMVRAMVAPVVIEENWVLCDSCQQWRLLPFGTKPDQLPEKWLCSMLNWLPGMNRCDITEEETTKALNALYQIPVSESQNNLQNQINGTAPGVSLTDVQHLDRNHHNLSSHAMSNRGKKKQGLKEIANAGISGGPIQISNSSKNQIQESVKSRSLNDMNQRRAQSNAMKKSSQHTSKSPSLVVGKDMPNLKEKQINGGDAKQKKMKSKRDTDQYECRTSKKSKKEDVYANKYRNSDMDPGRVGISSGTALPTKGSGKDMRKYDEYCLSEDTKYDVHKVPASKKLGDQAQVSLDGGSSDMRMCNKLDGSLKKRKLKDWQDSHNQIGTFHNSAHDGKIYEKEESSDSGFRKVKKFRVLKTEGKESSTNNADDKSNKKDWMPGNLLSGSRDHTVDCMDGVRKNDKDRQLRKHMKKTASQRNLDGVDSMRRDLGSGQVSMAATSSSSKVSGSHKTRANFEEVKGSPVESVSSSPLRTSNLDKFTLAGVDVIGKDDAMNSGLPVMGDFGRCSDGDGNAEINLSGTAICPQSHKSSALDYRDGDDSHKFSGKVKRSSEVGNSHLLNDDVDTVDQNSLCLNDLHAPEHSYDENRVNKNHRENAVLHKCGKASSLRSRDKDRSSTSEFDRDKMKASDPVNEYMKKGQRNDSEIDPNRRVPGHETMSDVKHSFLKKSISKFSKDEKNHVSRRDSVGQWSSDSGIQNRLKQKEHDGSDVKSSAPCSTNGKVVPQQNLIQDFEDENKADLAQMEPRSGKSKLFPRSDGEGKLGKVSKDCEPVSGPQKGGTSDGIPIVASGDLSKALKHSGNVGNNNGVNHSLQHHVPDRRGAGDLNASSPVSMISSSQTATNTLKEAKELRGYADVLKSSGFAFESNLAYFRAALKFLHGASLLETCNSESGRHKEMNQMQVYSTTAKLFELCAHEYEREQEMAAAALAYKCMEAAYMKLVYCKHASMNRDRNELQATLVVAQGESPSSSASDVDNLNNQATVDKANLSKGTGSHIAGNQVIVTRHRPKFVRLLDFTQDVNFALEASRKSQNAFVAADVTLEEAQDSDRIASLKRVIDFSFQDVEEFIRLVQHAMEAISRRGFGGARG